MSNKNLFKWEDILKPGTAIYTIYYDSIINKRVRCKYCKGDGYITKGAATFTCDTCKGMGFTIEPNPTKWKVSSKPDIITRVEIQIVDISHSGPLYEIMYWLGCNGVRPEYVFLTKNAATRECKWRNESEEVNGEQKEC